MKGMKKHRKEEEERGTIDREGKNEEEEKSRGEKLLLPLPMRVQGKKKEEQCLSKRHRSVIFFFNMKRRRFGQNAPFHLNMAPTRQLPNQSLIYLLFISIESLPTSIAALIVGRLFHFRPWFPIYTI